MILKTISVEETDKLMSWIEAKDTVNKIKVILNNKRSHNDQIHAIRQLLEAV